MSTFAQAAAEQAAVEQKQYLTFMLGGEMFAIGILHIKEIIQYAGLTEVPMMPSCIRGVINLRGAVVPVMDLSARFGKKTTEVTRRTCIVIVEVENEDGRQDMGVVVDAVNAVLEIPSSEIEPAPAFGARIRTDFIEGMGKVNNRFVILLDVGRVLSAGELGALVQVGESAQQLLSA
ncbi:MAG TPA: chemotaxis protein CheW [Noviherbaspirillum sp.]|nr:chemotaxis protein CheW [Noviherbaspirillum sp.]